MNNAKNIKRWLIQLTVLLHGIIHYLLKQLTKISTQTQIEKPYCTSICIE